MQAFPEIKESVILRLNGKCKKKIVHETPMSQTERDNTGAIRNIPINCQMLLPNEEMGYKFPYDKHVQTLQYEDKILYNC